MPETKRHPLIGKRIWSLDYNEYATVTHILGKFKIKIRLESGPEKTVDIDQIDR